jgi:uncharacterized protein with PQ loop repeat
MDHLPKNNLLRISNAYALIMTPLMFISQWLVSLKEDDTEVTSGPALLGQILGFGLFVYVFWISYRTSNIYSGKCLRNQFKPVKKFEWYFTWVVMSVLFLTWVFMNWVLGKSGYGVFDILISVLIGIFPFHLLNMIYYLRDNKLVEGSATQVEKKEIIQNT